MSLVQKMLEGDLDILGDIHGEYDALITIIKNLGYDENGNHPNNRKLMFVGDFCDRGPDSPAVIFLIKKLIENGNAQAVLGNHEINLLQLQEKDGAGWYFKNREPKDHEYQPFAITKDEDRDTIYNFLGSLPIALEREDLRIIHAVWDNERIEQIKNVPLGNIANYYKDWSKKINQIIDEKGLLSLYKAEQKEWKEAIENKNTKDIPILKLTAEYNLIHQMTNPVRVLTSGVEEESPTPFYASGKWRFVRRRNWWNFYEDEKPVVIGHYWRKMINTKSDLVYGGERMFNDIHPLAWHGKNNNVFCVDYSVGARFKERHQNKVGENTNLVALNWPEKTLTLENGERLNTINFQKSNKISP